jgi:hypothetical protein
MKAAVLRDRVVEVEHHQIYPSANVRKTLDTTQRQVKRSEERTFAFDPFC